MATPSGRSTARPSAPPELWVLSGAAAGTLLLGLLLGLLDVAVGPAAPAAVVVVVLLVAAAVTLWDRLPAGSPARRWLAVAAVAVASAGTGVVVTAAGARFGAPAVVLLPLGLAVAAVAVFRPVVLLAVVVVALPVGLVEPTGVPLGLQVVQIVTTGAVALAVTARLVAGKLPIVVPSQMFWVVALVAWGVVATLDPVDPDRALRQTIQLTVNVGLALVVVTVVRTTLTVRRLLWLVLGVASLSCLPALAGGQQLRSGFGGGVVDGRLVGIFTQPNQFGTFTMVVLALGTGLALGAQSRRERALVLLALAPVVAGLLLSLSRSAWVGAVASALVLLVLLPAARRTLVQAGLPLALTALALGAFAPESPQVRVVGERVATFAEAGGGNPYDDRPRIWAEGLREARLEPLVGHGPASFPVVSTRSGSQAQTVQADHAHNVLLTVAAEYGLPGAALLVAFGLSCAVLARTSVRRATGPDAALVAGLAAAAAGVAAQGLLDYTMRNAVLFTFLWLVAGLLVAAARASLRQGPQHEVVAPDSEPTVGYRS